MALTISLSCLSCGEFLKKPDSLNVLPSFNENALLFPDLLLRRIPFPNPVSCAVSA